MVAAPIIDRVRGYLAGLTCDGVPVSFAVVFGSHARGEARDTSDIDLVVVSPYYDEHRSFDDVSRLWLVKATHDWRLEPIACGLREWEQDDTRPILEVARREGIRILPAA